MPFYRNSENTVEFTYERLAQPRSEQELIELVRQSARDNRKLKPSGGDCSFNHIKKTEDTLVDLGAADDFTRVLSIDHENMTATIGGGMILADAIEELNGQGLHFPTLGGWHGQTVAGAIATSTHGSSFAHGTLSDHVVEIDAILSDGSRVHLTDQNDELKAWRVNLGQLGIVTRVKFQLAKPFYLKCRFEDVEDDREGFGALSQRVSAWENGDSNFVSLLWLPYFGDSGRTLTRILSPVADQRPNQIALDYEEKWARRDGRLLVNVREDRGAVMLGKAFLRHPQLYKNMWSNAMANAYLDDDGVIDRSFRLFCYEQFREPTENHWLRQVLSVEIAVEASRLGAIFAELRELIRDHLGQRSVANYPRFHVRFADASNKTWLGTNVGRRTAYFNTYFCGAVLHGRQIPLAMDIERVLDAHGGRPHWGKFRHLGNDERYRLTYGENMSKFEAYRRAVDPQGMFSDGWEMFRDLDMLDNDDLITAPLSGMNPDNYKRMRFLGGRSSSV